jgi:carbonic anhydrase
MEGNARFVAGEPRSRPTVDLVRRLAGGQSPYATVVACADSRVPVEILFDHDPGEIFVVRLAGNFLSDAALGSVEYAVEVLKSPLVMVLGHTKCGAVQAAVESVRNGNASFPGHIQMLADALTPAALATKNAPGDWWHNAVLENVRITVEKLTASEPIMRAAIDRGAVQVVGGVYDLATGAVDLV